MHEFQVGEYQIRRPKKSDHIALAQFGRDIWPDMHPDKMTKRWWWNDWVKPQCLIAEHIPTKEIAAMCGERRTRLRVKGEIGMASSICDWNVSHRHRGHGLGRILVEASSQTHPVMYTTSISESAVMGFMRLGWGGDSVLPVFVANPLVVLGISAFRQSEYTISKFDLQTGIEKGLEDINVLWASLGEDALVMMVRDAAFIQSHMALVPHRKYTLLVCHRDKIPVGYALYRILPAGSFRRFKSGKVGLVSDFLIHPDSSQALVPILRAMAKDMLLQGCLLMTVLTTVSAHTNTLTKLGFVSPQFPLFGRWLNQLSSRAMSWSKQELPGFSRGWHVTFADNDTDLILGSSVE